MSPLLLFFTIVISLLWIGAMLLWVQVYRAPENIPIRFFAATLTLLSLNFLVNAIPGTSPPVELLIINLLALATGFAKIGFFVSVTYGSSARRRIVSELVIVLVLAAIASGAWLLAPAELRAVLPGPEAANLSVGFVFSISIIGYLLYVSVWTVLWTRRLVPKVQRRVLRISLISIAVGACAHIVNASMGLYTAIQRFIPGLPPVTLPGVLFQLPILTSLAYIALLVGAVTPIVDGVIREIPLMLQQKGDLRAVTPLWTALVSQFPELSLRVGGVGPSRVLYRRTVEIRDGLVLLSPHYDPAVAEEARASSVRARESEADQAITVQAALVASALDAHRDGRVVAEPATLRFRAGADWQSDREDLVRLAKRFAEIVPSSEQPTSSR